MLNYEVCLIHQKYSNLEWEFYINKCMCAHTESYSLTCKGLDDLSCCSFDFTPFTLQGKTGEVTLFGVNVGGRKISEWEDLDDFGEALHGSNIGGDNSPLSPWLLTSLSSSGDSERGRFCPRFCWLFSGELCLSDDECFFLWLPESSWFFLGRPGPRFVVGPEIF